MQMSSFNNMSKNNRLHDLVVAPRFFGNIQISETVSSHMTKRRYLIICATFERNMFYLFVENIYVK